MRKSSRLLFKIISFVAAMTVLNANAHDPKLHMKKKAEKPKCEMMEKMKAEGKKMDPNDPVMVAMMKKCHAKHMQHNQDAKGDDHHEKGKDHAQH